MNQPLRDNYLLQSPLSPGRKRIRVRGKTLACASGFLIDHRETLDSSPPHRGRGDQRSQRGMVLARVVAAAVLLCSTILHAADDDQPVSVASLVADKAKWPDRIDQPIRVEGRVSTVTKHQFRFVNCELTFHVTEDQSRTVGKSANIEVAGRFRKDKETGKPIVIVERVKIAPTDTEQFDLREAKQKSTRPEDWLALANWAEQRGEFYRDNDLKLRARRATTKAIELEHAALPADDLPAREKLLARLSDRQLEPALQAELKQEIMHIRWQNAQSDSKKLPEFIAWLAKDKPASLEPLKSFPTELAKDYESHPLRTYRDADEKQREQFPRLLMIQAELARILPQAKPDGSNAPMIADLLKAKVPERADLIARQTEAGFQYRLKSVPTASRQDAIQLADELKTRDRSDDAKTLLKTWLTAQEPRLRKDGPIGLMQLAEDYLRLLSDEPTAVKLLADAHQVDPSFEDVGERLKQLGYQLDGGQWIKAGGEKKPAMTPDKAHSQLAMGMTSSEVLSLLGTPNAKSRVITGDAVYEVWAFGRRGTSRLLIHLQRPSLGDHPKVLRFLTEN